MAQLLLLVLRYIRTNRVVRATSPLNAMADAHLLACGPDASKNGNNFPS